MGAFTARFEYWEQPKSGEGFAQNRSDSTLGLRKLPQKKLTKRWNYFPKKFSSIGAHRCVHRSPNHFLLPYHGQMETRNLKSMTILETRYWRGVVSFYSHWRLSMQQNWKCHSLRMGARGVRRRHLVSTMSSPVVWLAYSKAAGSGVPLAELRNTPLWIDSRARISSRWVPLDTLKLFKQSISAMSVECRRWYYRYHVFYTPWEQNYLKYCLCRNIYKKLYPKPQPSFPCCRSWQCKPNYHHTEHTGPHSTTSQASLHYPTLLHRFL